eukprot:CAMPEP_0175730332 /NCGR_PEP_ID=MMETSP0097-20121207/50268_1 /TAXON_ID=311494 /ORGANISM="Alexandrium monilatum, Strain CCMP3105" /LENGTH=291 /DNA_ID=CAMNT_0017038229 /DNA_START=147 /DNA_END=1023 /DNA_ORIENTATION=-
MQESAAWTSVLVDGQDQASCDRSDGGCAQEGPSLSLLQNHAVGVAAKGSAASVAASISGESPSRRRDDGASSIDVALRSQDASSVGVVLRSQEADGNAAGTKTASRGADRQAKVLGERGLYRGDAEDDEAQKEGKDELPRQGLEVGAATAWLQRQRPAVLHQRVREASEDPAAELGGYVGEHPPGRDEPPTGAEDGRCDRGIEVSTRDSAQGEDHAHERGSDGEDGGRGTREDVEPHGEDQHVGAQELAQQVHAQRALAYLPSYAIAELMGGVVAACVFRATHAAEFAEKA